MHIHIPDGVLPIWLWVFGFIFVGILLILILPNLKKEQKGMPKAAMIAAVILLVMSIPLGLPGHINLMVLAALLIGPAWSLVIALICNFILASFGHGGITLVGLNTLLLWFQAVVGFFLFKMFLKIFKNYFLCAVFSTFLSLCISFLFLIGIVAVSTVEPAEFLHHHEILEQIGDLGHTEISLKMFILLSLPVALWGAVIEAFVTGFIVQFIKKTAPKLLKL
jgi:cobalt/nickel transport system permease protein